MLSFPILLSHVGGRSHVFVLDPGAGLCLSCLSKLLHSSTGWGRKKNMDAAFLPRNVSWA